MSNNNLTAGELCILQYLRSKDGPCLREEIIRHCAEMGVMEADTLKRTVDTMVRYIRMKTSPSTITTVKGVGYAASN